MATIIGQDIKTGQQQNVEIADGTPIDQVQKDLAELGLRLVPSTAVKVVAEDGSPVDYPYPADMPIDAVMQDLASKGWTLADSKTGTAVPRGPVGTNPTAKAEADAINAESVGAGAYEMYQDLTNVALRPFMDPAEYTARIVKQAAEKKQEQMALDRRTQNLQQVSGAEAYPGFMNMLPRAVAEGATEFALTRNMRSALGRIGTAGAVAGGFETLDKSDMSFIQSLGTGGGTTGFGVGVAFSALGELPSAAKRWLGKSMTEALEARGIFADPTADPFHLDAPQPDLGGRASEIAGIPLMPYQALEADGLARMTSGAARAPGSHREAFEAAQARATSSLFENLANRYLPSALVPNGFFNRSTATRAVAVATDRYRQFLDDTMGQVRDRFNMALRPALTRAGASVERGSGIITGGQAILPASEYLRTLRAMAKQARETGLSPDQLAPLEQEITRLTDAGGWTVGGFQNRLMLEGRRSYGGTRTAGSWMELGDTFDSRAIFAAMQRDLDKAIAVGDEPLAQVGGMGAPNRTQYTGTGRGWGGEPGANEGAGNAEDNLQAWMASGQAGLAPGGTPGLPGAPQGPQAPSAPRGVTPPRNPMALSDPIHDPYEAAYRAMDEAALRRLRGTQDVRAVATSLKAARDGFAADMDAMRQVNESVINRLFGGGNPHMTGDEYRTRFMSLEPDQKVEVMRFMDQHMPSAANSLRGALFSSIVDRARAARGSAYRGANTVDIGVFARELGSLQRAEMEALLPSGLSEGDRRRVLAGMLTMETISKAPDLALLGNAQGFIPRMRAAAINVVLRNEGFVASFLTGEASPAALERMLYTREGIRGWMQLGRARPGSAAMASALASLADQMWNADRDVEEIKRRAQEKAAEEEMQQRGNQPGMVPGM